MKENSELCVLIDSKDLNKDLFAKFPYLENQFMGGLEDNEDVDTDQTFVIINLGDESDTSLNQEIFLNNIREVIEYSIR